MDVTHKSIKDCLEKCDTKDVFDLTPEVKSSVELRKNLKKIIDLKSMTDKSVLGIDIYKYSKYPVFKQSLIPILFKFLYDQTIELVTTCESYLFQKCNSNYFIEKFIDTGDGGFIIFDSPLHSLVFLIHFALQVRNYNSYHFYPRFRKIIGPITLRYAITTDNIYHYNNNYYGTSIINNSRIIGRDKLDRLLFDTNTINWFMLNINGLENMPDLTLDRVSCMTSFRNYIVKTKSKNVIIEFQEVKKEGYGIIDVNIMKLENIKDIEFEIYNITIKVRLSLVSEENNEGDTFIYTIGNLNNQGLSDA